MFYRIQIKHIRIQILDPDPNPEPTVPPINKADNFCLLYSDIFRHFCLFIFYKKKVENLPEKLKKLQKFWTLHLFKQIFKARVGYRSGKKIRIPTES